MENFLIGAEDLAELRRSLRQARDWLEERGLAHNIPEALARFDAGENVWAASPCYIAWLHARVRLDGTVQACLTCDHKLGDLNRQSLEEIWNGAGYRRFRRALSQRLPAALQDACDCSYCCYFAANLQVHRFYRCVAPFARLGRCVS